MPYAMDNVACLAQMRCQQTPGLQHQGNFLLKIFLNGKKKCHIKHFYWPKILYILEKYQILTQNKVAQDKTIAKSFNLFGLVV
jgi:hypothetical protein